MTTSALLAPVVDDLALVEEMIASVARVEYPVLGQLLSHILRTRGKRVRPAIVLLAAQFNEYRLDRLVRLATAIELLHTATLVHDDFIDNSATRRGRPTLHQLTSSGAAILVGDYLFAQSAVFCTQTANVRVMGVFGETLTIICDGELRQLFSPAWWQQTRAEYYQKIESKTASLVQTAAETGAILSGATEHEIAALRTYGLNLGMAFQIVDDVLDFVGDEKTMGKPVGTDLRQRTLTLPAIWLRDQRPEHPALERVFRRDAVGLKDHDLDQADGEFERAVHEAVQTIVTSPAIDACLAEARSFGERARRALEALRDIPARRALLDLVDYVIDRSS
ncbi:MAG: polyprenyl synthetase family protein [Chloroflexi bacterium]|nr:polyprenyl synthetase family protein [Chloroflexota bacterium]